MRPLLIVKFDCIMSRENQVERTEIIKRGIREGALILDGKCEIIAFDREGRLSYPVREVVKSEKL